MPKQNLPNVYEDTLTAKIDRELGGRKGLVNTRDMSGNSLGTTMVSQGYKKNIKLTSRAVEITVSVEMYDKNMEPDERIRINGRYQNNYRVTIKGQFSVNDEIIPETYTSVHCVEVDKCYQAYGKNKHGNFTLLLYRKKPITTKKQPTWFMSKTYTSFKQASSATKKKYQSPKAWYREHERTVDLITSENEKRNRKNQKKRVLFKPEESVRTPRRAKKKKTKGRQKDIIYGASEANSMSVPEEYTASDGTVTSGCYLNLIEEKELFLKKCFKDKDLFSQVKHLLSQVKQIGTVGYLYEQMIQQQKCILKDPKAEATLKEGLQEWVKTTKIQNPYYRFSYKKWIKKKSEEWKSTRKMTRVEL